MQPKSIVIATLPLLKYGSAPAALACAAWTWLSESRTLAPKELACALQGSAFSLQIYCPALADVPPRHWTAASPESRCHSTGHPRCSIRLSFPNRKFQLGSSTATEASAAASTLHSSALPDAPSKTAMLSAS